MPATFYFYLREDRPDKRGCCPIILRIIHNRKKKYINTGIRIKPNEWNPDKELVRKKHHACGTLNQELEEIRNNASKAYRELNREHKASAESIRKRLDYSSKDNFFDLADEYLTDLKSSGQFWSHKQAKVAIEKLRKFHGSGHLPVNNIDAEYLMKFQSKLKKQCMASTLHKNFGAIKNILQIAVRQHLIPFNPMQSENFKLIKINGEDSKTKLSLDQITAIETLDLKPGSILWHSRNAFILAFYFCGMRFGDVAELRWSNIKNNRLQYKMNKTGTPVSIPIKYGAKAILDQYDRKTTYIFPFLESLTEEERKDSSVVRRRISSWNAVVNGQNSGGKTSGLKAIAKLAGIDEEVSMHVARHSFAQYGVNDRNIPPYKMMMLLGHKNIKTTMQYLKSLDLKTVDNVMDEIF